MQQITNHLLCGHKEGPLLLGASLSSLLLALAHSPFNASEVWAAVALVPILYTIKQHHRYSSIMFASVLTAIGPGVIMFESILVKVPAGALAAILLYTFQLLLPLIVWRTLLAHSTLAQASLSFLATWILLEKLRALPLVNGNIASFYSVAHTQQSGILFDLGSVGGTTLVALLILTVNVLIATTTTAWRFIILAAAIVAGLLISDALIQSRIQQTDPSTKALQVAGLQAAWTAPEYWLIDHSEEIALEKYTELIALIGTSSEEILVFTSEALLRNEHSVSFVSSQLGQIPVAELFAGSVEADGTHVYNSIVRITQGATEHLYRKWQLVPFYETSLFSAGNYVSTYTTEEGIIIGFVICMDGTLDWLLLQTALAGAHAVVVISSTEYGRGYSTPQLQLQLAQFHAATFAVPMLFVSSNGPTSTVDFRGRIQDVVQEGEQALLKSILRVPVEHSTIATVPTATWTPIAITSGLGLTILALPIIRGFRMHVRSMRPHR